MASEVSAKFRDEKIAIEQLRRLFPDEKQMTLAKRIRTNNFADADHQALATKAGLRSRFSIYSVIRRYDSERKALIANAVNVAESEGDTFYGNPNAVVTVTA